MGISLFPQGYVVGLSFSVYQEHTMTTVDAEMVPGREGIIDEL